MDITLLIQSSKVNANERKKEGEGMIMTEQLSRRVTINEPISPINIHMRIEPSHYDRRLELKKMKQIKTEVLAG